MTARSPSAFFASLTLHSLFIGVAVLTAYIVHEEVKPTTKVFELVAGEGDNYAATEAPALGSENGVKLNMPELPAPKMEAPPKPEPVAPPIEKPVPVPPPEKVVPQKSPVTAVADTKPTEQKIPDFAKQVEKAADRREARIIAKYHKQQKALQDAQEKAAALEKKRLTYEEYMKEQQGKGSASKTPSSLKYSKIDGEGIAKGVLGGSTANKVGGAGGKALAREEADLLEAYFIMLKERLQQAHEKEKPAGLGDTVSATAEFYVGVDGVISRVNIVRSSGYKDFDESVLAAFRDVHSVGPRPDGKGDTHRVTFRMREEE